METEINTILGGKVKVMQFLRGVKVSSDAVLLSSVIDYAVACKYRDVLDVGCGGGGIFLSLLHRFGWLNVVGVDLQPEMLELAKQSVTLNNVDGKVRLVQDDIFALKSDIKEKLFDIVITNPPYYKGHTSPDKVKARAHSEQGLDLVEWISVCVKRLRGHGVFAMVHKAERIDDILYALKKNSVGRVEVFPLASHSGEVANRVIVRGVKLSRTPAKIYPPVILHSLDGTYTSKAEALLSEGKSLPDVVMVDMAD